MSQDFLEARKHMVTDQLHIRGISNRLILEAFESIPRHLFVPETYRDVAYEDHPLRIGFEQTISQPFVVAYMIQALELIGTERVLEVGTGSGYQTAILSQLVPEVHTIELIPALAKRAAKTIGTLEIKNVVVHIGDGSQGWSESAPYDAIIVSAAAPQVPKTLLNQLADHGRLILPVGGSGSQYLELWQRDRDSLPHETLLPVVFVPLKGREGIQAAK